MSGDSEGNSWGQDPDGTQCIGCGYQEEFYGCADVRIVPSSQGITPQPTAAPTATPAPTTTTTTPSGNGVANCKAAGEYVSVSGMNEWCATSCAAGICPSDHCTCGGAPTTPTPTPTTTTTTPSGNVVVGCRAAGEFVSVAGMDAWCVANCAAKNCPSSHCICS